MVVIKTETHIIVNIERLMNSNVSLEAAGLWIKFLSIIKMESDEERELDKLINHPRFSILFKELVDNNLAFKSPNSGVIVIHN